MIDQDEHPDRPSPPPRERRLAVAWRSKASAVASTKLRHRWPNSERWSAFVGGPPSAGHQGFNPPPHHHHTTPPSIHPPHAPPILTTPPHNPHSPTRSDPIPH